MGQKLGGGHLQGEAICTCNIYAHEPHLHAHAHHTHQEWGVDAYTEISAYSRRYSDYQSLTGVLSWPSLPSHTSPSAVEEKPYYKRSAFIQEDTPTSTPSLSRLNVSTRPSQSLSPVTTIARCLARPVAKLVLQVPLVPMTTNHRVSINMDM